MSNSFLPRRLPPTQAGSPAADAESAFASTFPWLWAFLTSVVYADGSSRETGTLTLFGQESVLKGCLRDREGRRVVFSSERTVEAVLAALEGILEAGVGDWRADRAPPSGRRK